MCSGDVLDRGAPSVPHIISDVAGVGLAVLLPCVLEDGRGVGEVDVDVWLVRPRGVDEAFELHERELHRVNLGDPEQVADQRSGGRATSRADALFVDVLGPYDQVSGDEEIVAKSLRLDQAELVAHPLDVALRVRVEPLCEPLVVLGPELDAIVDPLFEQGGSVVPSLGFGTTLDASSQVFDGCALRQLDVAPVGDLACSVDRCLGLYRVEVAGHELLDALRVGLGVGQPNVIFPSSVLGLDRAAAVRRVQHALDRILLGIRIMHIRRRDRRHTVVLADVREKLVEQDCAFQLGEHLHFEVEPVAVALLEPTDQRSGLVDALFGPVVAPVAEGLAAEQGA